MRRFFVQELEKEEGACIIYGAEAKHITKVLRLGRGDRLILMDGQGEHYQAVIQSISSKDVRVVIERTLPKPPPSPIEITVCQSLLKSQPMDYAVQKTAELGVHRIVPFISERTVVRPDDAAISNKLKHWKKIAYSTAKQSGGGVPIKIGPVFSFNDMMDHWKEKQGLKVILWEQEKAKDLKGLLKESPVKKNVVGIIGPEGGFSQREVRIAEGAGFSAISLGHRILRTETAATVLVALFQYEWGDLGLFGG